MLIIVKTNLHKSQRTAIHIGKSHKPTHKPKLANKYVFANAVEH